jgi:hypothetical protein
LRAYTEAAEGFISSSATHPLRIEKASS